jgi:hypothetical protein
MTCLSRGGLVKALHQAGRERSFAAVKWQKTAIVLEKNAAISCTQQRFFLPQSKRDTTDQHGPALP